MHHALSRAALPLVLTAACATLPQVAEPPAHPITATQQAAREAARDGAPDTAADTASDKSALESISKPTPDPTKEESMASAAPTSLPTSFHALKTTTLDGRSADLGDYRGKVLLVVNTASECGLTPQYAGLEKLHEELSGDDFTVLGFPSNDFGGQEPGTPKQIQEFCSTNYAVTFPLFAKVQTKSGEGQSPIYAWLGSKTGSLPRWNFGKYVIGKDGTSVAFFDSKVEPNDPALRAAIDEALKAH